MFITETNYSQNETDAAQEVTGALWYAEMMGSLLSTGASGAFFYEYEPIPAEPGLSLPRLGQLRRAARRPQVQSPGAAFSVFSRRRC